MAGGFRISLSLAANEAELHRVRGYRPPDFAQPGVALWSSEPLIGMEMGGVVIGHLFTRGPPSRRVNALGPEETRRLTDNPRSLLADYWGGYVMVCTNRNGQITILRDPSGALPCYMRRDGDAITLAGDIADLASPGSSQVDFEEIVRIVASADAPGPQTCLKGITELLAGECLVSERGSVAVERWWSPWDHVEPDFRLSFANTAEQLRTTISDCVGAWASCFSSILLGTSGGLDSSIVAAASAPNARQLKCLNLVGPDSDGDERRYAHALAKALGLNLSEAHLNLADIDIDRAAATQHPWPNAPFFKQAIEAIHTETHQEFAIDAHFSGNGGDGIFCGMRSTLPLLDHWRTKGVSAEVYATLRNLCVLSGSDAMTVLRHMWDKHRRNGGRHIIRYDFEGFTADAAERIEAAGPMHPWTTAPAGVLPGKTTHVAFLQRCQRSIELYPRKAAPPHVAPLHSQPILELCLSIPTWMWIDGGRNRAVAREAFKRSLPPIITERIGKGGPGGFSLSIYRRHRKKLHEALRDGVLARAGILDLRLLDAPEDISWRGTERVQRILALGAAERWARWWCGT